ncbi:hypothetical protein ACFVXW_16605 [Streptomyces sp. NPDC058251]|uniref:hypothetical protein n=1 Tax=unclassified Streptomyces TaxID=2593676 RepID=UPI0036E1A617
MAVDRKLCFDMGAFHGPGLDHRQELLYLPRPYSRGLKEIGHTKPGTRGCLFVHDDQR